MNQLQLPGVAFVPVEFTPSSSKFANQLCSGINIAITDRNALRPVELGLTLASVLRREYPDAWETKNLNRLLGNQAVYKLLLDGKPSNELIPSVSAGVSDFLRRRDAFLIYR